MKKLFFLVLLLPGPGCVTTGRYKRDLAAKGSEEYSKGSKDASDKCLIAVNELEKDLAAKNARLKKFNQVDDQGRLRPVSPCYDNPSLPGCGGKTPTGKEKWLK
jgi:hypothetical protein